MKINHTELSTKERLFKAAIRVFAEKGYEAATVRDICHRADANVASVNYHYGDKEKLYFQVVLEIFKVTRETRTPHLSPDAPPYDRLKTFIRSTFEEILPSAYLSKDQEECMAMGTIFMLEMARPTGALDSIVKDYISPDNDELNNILTAILGEDAPPEMIGMSAASVIAQPLHFFYSMPIIQRLNPDKGEFLTDPGFIDYATEHIFQFCVGGLEHFKKNLRGK
ncbi:CerR family C-terminal domain-containing protein [Desulfovibrio ferrophilus]|uniref:Regulatory protein TetR n=1 Tax=Desulfovibrio ferrophilus TaxID=241368 RepID=A0A2Z6B2S9_9BACT|nr:CerR family C-terminal domain-containing protein [Desulfovibrio ferrophilus]BBD09817.1 regulatory protein TetR [Desulfovibrio ferrophilus]